MHKPVVIKVENVSKKYCRSFKESMQYGMSDIGRNIIGLRSHSDLLRKDEFWALDDVSFEIKRGEAFGLIGSNGSGKTTLLKMLSGIFMPDKGKITITGRVGALIAVGAGFHPMLTGRENVYINGAILGMTKKEVDDKFDSIVEFADIGDFLDAPVKTYSSGMFVRLGFAVAVHCEPDILLIDEVLAVGDKDFQIKCYQKIAEIRKNGTTIILVAHNENVIREYTSKVIYLFNGTQKYFGSSEDAISVYIKDVLEHRSKKTATNPVLKSKQYKKAEIIALKFYDKSGQEVSFLESGQELNITLECQVKEKLNNPIFGVYFYDDHGFSYCINSDYENESFNGELNGLIKIKIKVPEFHLPMNSYLCTTLIAEEIPDNLIDWHDKSYRFVVGRAHNARGSIKLPTQWTLEQG